MSKHVPRIVCLGNFTIDHVHLPDGRVVSDCIGGDALYAALGARLWERRVALVAPVGKDMPLAMIETLRRARFSIERLPRRDAPTLRNRIFYHAQGNRSWEPLYTPESFVQLSPLPQDIPRDYREAEVFLILAMALEAQECLVSWLRSNTRGLIALDTQEDYIEGNQRRLMALIPQVDIFLPSSEEVFQLVGHRDWGQAAEYFSSHGPRLVVIKQGPLGALVYRRDKKTLHKEPPAIDSDPVDATGAGDAFCGGFIAQYIRDQRNTEKAARAGAISASFALASFGVEALLAATPASAEEMMARDIMTRKEDSKEATH